ncbi:Uncharacterised protein [Streptococcus pneumoniae]|nr:Uncharacterised protein [Streptococcus pneumoniae]
MSFQYVHVGMLVLIWGIEDKKSINFSKLLDSLIVSEYQMEANLLEVSHD